MADPVGTAAGASEPLKIWIDVIVPLAASAFSGVVAYTLSVWDNKKLERSDRRRRSAIVLEAQSELSALIEELDRHHTMIKTSLRSRARPTALLIWQLERPHFFSTQSFWSEGFTSDQQDNASSLRSSFKAMKEALDLVKLDQKFRKSDLDLLMHHIESCSTDCNQLSDHLSDNS